MGVTSMNDRRHKPLMRSLGEFFGHLVKAVRADPSRKVVKKTIEEQPSPHDQNVILRRTTIEEVEIRRESP